MRDPYHLAVALTWPQFFAALLLFYLLVNVAFAAFFWVAPGSVANARPYSFPDAFFFSIETLATVGYGEMYPATPYGHVIVATRDRLWAGLHGYFDRTDLCPILAATGQVRLRLPSGCGDA